MLHTARMLQLPIMILCAHLGGSGVRESTRGFEVLRGL